MQMGIFHLLVYFLVFVWLSNAESFDYPTANLFTSWKNSPSLPHSVDFQDGSRVRSILLRGTFGPKFACGFFCNGTCDSYLFAIFIVQTNSISGITSPAIGFPQLVWSANRNNPVRINSTLQLTSNGDFVLKDVDGNIAWSTGTAGKSVAGLNLTEMGNLVLFDNNNSTVWQSFDHPTDSLVPGQRLISGHKLIPSMSPTNWTQLNLLSLSVNDEGMYASVESNPVQVYSEMSVSGTKTNKEPTYVTLRNGSFALFANSSEPSEPDMFTPIPESSSAQYARFWSDGHLRVHEWGTNGWQVVADVLSSPGYECFYPTVCGNYGICSNGQCSCPAETANGKAYFKQIDVRQPSLGCSETTPLSCQGLQNHSFIELTDTTYASFNEDLKNVDLESCRNACSMNCSCKAAIFRYGSDSANGFCYLPNQIFSLINNVKEQTHYNSTIYLKVQNDQTPPAEAVVPQQKKKSKMAIILSSSIVPFVLIFIGVSGLLAWKKNRNADDDLEEDYLDQVPGLPTRFSHEELKALTDNFSKMLGEGGFGSVFEGTLADGTKIAVKRLNGIGPMKKSFLAEVESIGSIHHVNLARLLGFCVDKSNMLLVYEFMCNGSLDKWIFHQTPELSLDWKQRKKIILDIAKGLNYLHEDCSQKIIHLDIKPQNILLDDKLNGKISDFGLSKLVNREESKVVTAMRGTPGYLAPEWLSSIITEKVDVYSFGVVVLEMLCGRRNVDHSEPEERMHLLSMFERKAEEDRVIDLVDDCNEDMKLHRAEISNMMKIATWCLQKDYTKRPSMSMVVKVLEGDMEVEQKLDYDLSNPVIIATTKESTPLLPSLLSGPR
ncbi:G-type lectin S-receptor-like serine/threonine-protein kinase SD2-5 [Euphorbia lathyris]|uniref:G-type lectin S-receptor-like serine/threonine-protein kinase SD2-5 n=1 Tax=Euphorbia lathyris TaxID=212925 RepID=UPI0033132F53